MDAILKDVARLEALSLPPGAQSSSSKKSSSKSTTSTEKASLSSALDSLINILSQAQTQASTSNSHFSANEVLRSLENELNKTKEKVDDGVKVWHKEISKLGTSIDKALPTQSMHLPPGRFTNQNSQLTLDRAIMNSLARRGEWEAIDSLRQESGLEYPADKRRLEEELSNITTAMRAGDLEPALRWTEENALFLKDYSSSLPFLLHQSIYIKLLITPSLKQIPGHQAIVYAQTNLSQFYHTHQREIQRLLTAIIYLPVSKLSESVYADLLSPELHAEFLVPLFEKEYCSRLGWATKDPLSVVVNVGSSSAISKIEKGRKVMKDRVGPDWDMKDELPMEIPLPPSQRFHSIFSCPVSKEQASNTNPPMMLLCGHSIANTSLHKLSKGNRNVKCPYCPVESPLSSAIRLYF